MWNTPTMQLNVCVVLLLNSLSDVIGGFCRTSFRMPLLEGLLALPEIKGATMTKRAQALLGLFLELITNGRVLANKQKQKKTDFRMFLRITDFYCFTS